jgi:hypothetical protein
VEQLGPLWVVDQVPMLINSFVVRFIRDINRIIPGWVPLWIVFFAKPFFLMDVRPPNHDFKQEKGVLLTLLKLRGLVNNRAYDKLNVLLVVGETYLTVFRDNVCLFLSSHVPAFNRRLVMCVVKINTRLIELLDLKITKGTVDHPQRKL